MSKKRVNGFRFIGAILLIVGTSIGGGMLVLPIATASLGLIASSFYLFITWLLMTVGALLIVEVNACLPTGNNLVSMAGATIGRVGQILAWVAYLLLLYSLLAAYTAGGQEVLSVLAEHCGLDLGKVLSTFLFVVIFSAAVYSGTQQVDWVNRLIMLIKFIAYLAMIFIALPYVKITAVFTQPVVLDVTLSTMMIMLASYGFAIIVPSLRVYLHDNTRALRQAVIIGSGIPLMFYIVWEIIIFGLLPKTGDYSLRSLATSTQPVSTLIQVLSHIAQHSWIVYAANLFTSVCVITAFLGVSLSLMDFLADGFRVRKTGWVGLAIYFATFLPPLLLALFAKKVFVYGLSLAGIFCVYILILLPAWMAWNGRYQRGLCPSYTVWGGKPVLIMLIVLSVLLLLAELTQRLMPAMA